MPSDIDCIVVKRVKKLNFVKSLRHYCVGYFTDVFSCIVDFPLLKYILNKKNA